MFTWGNFHNIFCHISNCQIVVLFWQKDFYKQLFFSYKIMGSVNIVFVKEEKESGKKISYPDLSDIQRTRIIHIQFSHQEISVVKKKFCGLWHVF